ncbi:MAG: DUF4190 domain-containing protein [Terrabacter sp.]
MTAELPPPSGLPHPPPASPAPEPRPGATAYAFPTYAGRPGDAGVPAGPLMAPPRTPVPGTNGLAIAALCCGLVGLVPLAAVAAIVLGIVALNQLRDRIQRGKGMAIAGLVLGVLWVLGWAAFIVAAVSDAPARDASGAVTQTSDAFVEDLKAGDCFSGAGRTEVDSVTIIPCASPHESQVVTIFAMPAGPWPGKDKVVAAAEDGCIDKADPLITRQAYDDLRPSFIYPQDAFAWRGGREIICVVDAPTGTTTGSALK